MYIDIELHMLKPMIGIPRINLELRNSLVTWCSVDCMEFFQIQSKVGKNTFKLYNIL